MASICRDISEWVESEICEPVKRKREEAKKKCKKKKCKWWCACCNKWFCWIKIFIYWFIEWVVRIIGNWIVRAICETISLVLDLIKEIVLRLIGIIDFIGSLLGIRPKKFMRLKVYILLSDEKIPTQQIEVVQRWVDFTKNTFKEKMNIELHAADQRADNPIVEIYSKPSPNHALHPGCSFSEAFSSNSDYYESISKYNISGASDAIADKLGYGEPVFGFVVEDIAGGGKLGCAFPVLRDFFTIAHNPLTSTMAHEIGHLCGLWHTSDQNNLMTPGRDDEDCEMNRLQIAIFRDAKYVTFLHT